MSNSTTIPARKKMDETMYRQVLGFDTVRKTRNDPWDMSARTSISALRFEHLVPYIDGDVVCTRYEEHEIRVVQLEKDAPVVIMGIRTYKDEETNESVTEMVPATDLLITCMEGDYLWIDFESQIESLKRYFIRVALDDRAISGSEMLWLDFVMAEDILAEGDPEGILRQIIQRFEDDID